MKRCPPSQAALPPAAIAQALLAAAPEAASVVNEAGARVHIMAFGASLPIAELLVAAAPQAVASKDVKGKTALEVALSNSHGRAAVVRCLMHAAGHTNAVLLRILGALPVWKVAQPVYADVVASGPLTEAQWKRVPIPCERQGRALPAVLARSAGEAALLVRRLKVTKSACARGASRWCACSGAWASTCLLICVAG